MTMTLARTLAAAALLMAAVPAVAQVLDRIRETGVVRIGYRENAMPFSAISGAEPHGYSIDLCRAIAKDLAAPGGKPLRIEYRRVTPQDRLDQVVSGRVDLECGATTITEERGARVAFSPVIFHAGTRLLVKRGRAFHSLRDLSGRTVVAVRGTTNARVMVQAAGRMRDMRVTSATNYDEALTMLETEAVDALAADDILIAGLLAERGLGDQYIRVGEPLSPEPYGIAFALGDAALEQAVRASLARQAASRELRATYTKWFLKPLPSGATLGIPMSAHLEETFGALGLPPQ